MKMAFQDGIDCVLCISLHNLGLQLLLLLLHSHSSNSLLSIHSFFSKNHRTSNNHVYETCARAAHHGCFGCFSTPPPPSSPNVAIATNIVVIFKCPQSTPPQDLLPPPLITIIQRGRGVQYRVCAVHRGGGGEECYLSLNSQSFRHIGHCCLVATHFRMQWR